jgi:GDP-L-fucose synthase
MQIDHKIYVAGHSGMVGSAILRNLKEKGFANLVTRTHSELDLTNQNLVRKFFTEEKPDQVYLAAAKVGGIYANNNYPADFIYQNLMIEVNVIEAAFQAGVKKLLFLGSSCIYPRFVPQPMKESALMTGVLEPTNEPYAVAKIAGIKLCESFNRQFSLSHGIDYRCVMPTNLYGIGDNYHFENSHVIPSLIRRIHLAKVEKHTSVKVWGSGTPIREFLYVDDMAEACVFVMNLPFEVIKESTQPMLSHLNVGGGYEISILELAKLIKRTIGYTGEICYDSTKPDGIPRKLMDSSKLNKLGWYPKVDLEQGIALAYMDFLKNYDNHDK